MPMGKRKRNAETLVASDAISVGTGSRVLRV